MGLYFRGWIGDPGFCQIELVRLINYPDLTSIRTRLREWTLPIGFDAITGVHRDTARPSMLCTCVKCARYGNYSIKFGKFMHDWHVLARSSQHSCSQVLWSRLKMQKYTILSRIYLVSKPIH